MEALDAALAEATGVLFLCSGNVVRSAFAELYARAVGVPLDVASAATRFHNDRLFPETVAALTARGVPRAWIDGFRPVHLAQRLARLDPATVAFGMTPEHLAALAPRPELRRRGFLLEELRGEPRPIDDPVLEGADFEHTFGCVAACVDELARRLRAVAGASRGRDA